LGGRGARALRPLPHCQVSKFLDKTRLRLYQVSIQINLMISGKNLLKNKVTPISSLAGYSTNVT
jgi:hypothetical protein